MAYTIYAQLFLILFQTKLVKTCVMDSVKSNEKIGVTPMRLIEKIKKNKKKEIKRIQHKNVQITFQVYNSFSKNVKYDLLE